MTAGWNTWDVNYLNALVYLPDRLQVLFRLFDPASLQTKEKFNWREVKQLGPHAVNGMYSQIDLIWQDEPISLEYASEGKTLVCKIIPEGKCKLQLLVDMREVWGKATEPSVKVEGSNITTADNTWRLLHTGDPILLDTSLQSGNTLAFPLDQPVLIAIAPAEVSLDKEQMQDFLARQKTNYLSTALTSQDWLGDSAAGLTRSIHWNTIWEPIKGRVCTPVSREWCWSEHWGGYVLFDWDTFFCALMAVLESPALGIANLQAILQEITPRGFVPNYGAARTRSDDRSQPPVGSYCALKMQGFLGDENGWLSAAYPQLLQWHDWWMPARDGNGDGLLEWGSDPVYPDYQPFEVNTLRAAMFESGLDNSPMYDNAVFNLTTHTMELADVGLNAMYAMDTWALSEIASRLGLHADAQRLKGEFDELEERINRDLWNEAAGIYQNRHWDGRFSSHLSPTNFYPLIAGIVPEQRARRMIEEHLLNPAEFWGEYVLSSISRQDSGYRSGERLREGISQTTSDYWRGRIWGPMNFLVYEGLNRAGMYETAFQVADRSLQLFNLEWESESHVHENYNDLTGDGDDVNSSNPVYHWGALLAYMAFQELLDYEPWAGFRFGNQSGKKAALHGIHCQGKMLAVETDIDKLVVTQDGSLLLQTNQPVLIRGYQKNDESLSFQASARKPFRLILGCLPSGKILNLTINHENQPIKTDDEGKIALECPPQVKINLGGF